MATSSASLTDVSLQLPEWREVFELLTLQAGFNATMVVVGTALLGTAGGMIGAFTVLRKRALVADALAHAALPGLALMFLLISSYGGDTRSLPLLLVGATISGILGVITVQGLISGTRLNEDVAIGAVLSVFFGAGIVLLSLIQNLGTGGEGGLHHFIYGQAAAMTQSDVTLTALFATSTVIIIPLLFKELCIISFDQDFATVQGWPVLTLDLLLMALVVCVTITGLQSVGLILVVALLIIPPAAARFWTENLQTMVTLSAVTGAMSGYIGSSLSALLPRLPTGAVIVATAGLFFVISFLFAPQRGVIANYLLFLRARNHLQERGSRL